MWTTLAFAAALSLTPSQAAALDVTNVRPTYGLLGAPRPDSKFLPGDAFYLAFDLENLKLDANGNATYSMSIEVIDAKGKPHYQNKGLDKIVATNYFGGNKLPASAHVDIGLDQPPGEYTLKVNVSDVAGKKEKSISHKFEILPLTLGITRLSMSYDANGNLPAPMVGVVGELLTVNYVIVGFQRDKGAKPQPNFTIEMNILDENGKPTLAKPIADKIPNPTSIPEVPANLKTIDIHYSLPLNRPGKFTFEIKVTDALSKKSATAKFPLTVLATDKTR
jgi:hypothetical protein